MKGALSIRMFGFWFWVFAPKRPFSVLNSFRNWSFLGQAAHMAILCGHVGRRMAEALGPSCSHGSFVWPCWAQNCRRFGESLACFESTCAPQANLNEFIQYCALEEGVAWHTFRASVNASMVKMHIKQNVCQCAGIGLSNTKGAWHTSLLWRSHL